MGRYKSAAQDRRDAANVRGIFKLAFVAFVLLGIAGAAVYTLRNKSALDPSTLCPTSPTSITTVLVDVTDAMNLPQKQDFLNELERLRDSIPRLGALKVFKVDATSERLLVPVITRCNPGTDADVSALNGDKQLAAKRWEEGFRKPLDIAFADITKATPSARSPILESIQSIALTELKNQKADGKPRRLIVISDLLQNTNKISFYKGIPDSTTMLDSVPFRSVRTDLNGIDVELWMLERSDTKDSQPRALADLWEAMLRAMGGNVTRTYRVSG